MNIKDLVDYLMTRVEKNGDSPIYILIGDKEVKLETATWVGYPNHNAQEPRILLIPEDEKGVWQGLP